MIAAASAPQQGAAPRAKPQALALHNYDSLAAGIEAGIIPDYAARALREMDPAFDAWMARRAERPAEPAILRIDARPDAPDATLRTIAEIAEQHRLLVDLATLTPGVRLVEYLETIFGQIAELARRAS